MTLALGFFIDCSSPWPSSSVTIFLLISEYSLGLSDFNQIGLYSNLIMKYAIIFSFNMECSRGTRPMSLSL